MATLFIILGVINCMLIIATTLGVFGFFGLPQNIGFTITGFTSKTFEPYYFDSKIAHVVSLMAIIGLIVLFIKKEIGILKLLLGIFVNIIWMIYYKLVLMN